MSATLIVIFFFGLVITGIVLLGIQQAADWAKEDAAQKAQTELGSHKVQPVLPIADSPLDRPMFNTNRP